ncbi:MAG: AbrB/MazE/SpoVT family DNA-binding domain-containing protein [Geminicoccaceae bacterium]
MTGARYYVYEIGYYHRSEAVGSRVTRKGQVTIPKRVRDHLGIEPGSVVEFEVMPDGRIMLVKQGAPPEPSRFEKLRGTAPTKLTTDQLMALLRGDD